ncbi:MAG: winged helix DNA-binding domain-containing protein [Gordonia sp. (in: high G+C Gram-positive bacteria)]
MSDAITLGQWNRTLLERQHLLRRVADDAIDVLDRVVGMQSQDPRAPFYGLHSRIDGFVPDELDELLTDRAVVRMVLLRGTLFLVDAEDARWLRPLGQPALDAAIRTTHRRRLTTGADTGTVITEAAALLRGRELTGAALGAELAARFPGENPSDLTAVARCGLPLVQVPPRGLWRGRGGVTYRLFDDWVGAREPALTGDEARKELIRLYLRGFGPASAAGIGTWSGVRGLAPVLAAMERDWELVRYSGPGGETLYDLDGLGLTDADIPAPVRLVAPFDHVLVAQGDRGRIADADAYARTVTPNGRSPGFLLVDGRLAGQWKTTGSQVHTELFGRLSARRRAELDAEVERVSQWQQSGAGVTGRSGDGGS